MYGWKGDRKTQLPRISGTASIGQGFTNASHLPMGSPWPALAVALRLAMVHCLLIRPCFSRGLSSRKEPIVY